MLISIKQVLLILAVISWSCLPKQSVLEAFSLHFWRKPRTFHTCALYGVAEEEAFRERVSRETRQEQQWENVPQWHSQEGPYSIDSPHYIQKHWPEISLVCFQPALLNLHGIAIGGAVPLFVTKLHTSSIQEPLLTFLVPFAHLQQVAKSQFIIIPSSVSLPNLQDQHPYNIVLWNTMSFFLLLSSKPAIKQLPLFFRCANFSSP